uniref:Secreted protein n=1 Tax=Ascaris lumbricoides TaxID=6252 RepID=A0A0M3ICP8_ASCLU
MLCCGSSSLAHSCNSPVPKTRNEIRAMISTHIAIKNEVLQPINVPRKMRISATSLATRCSSANPLTPASAPTPFENPIKIGAYRGASYYLCNNEPAIAKPLHPVERTNIVMAIVGSVINAKQHNYRRN